MAEHQDIYQASATQYEQLVSREDYLGHLLPAIQKIVSLQDLNVVELGAGTGRVTRLLAPQVCSIHAFDASAHMLSRAAASLKAGGRRNWRTTVADHRALPVPAQSADLAISGWSICYLVSWNPADWEPQVHQALAEMRRILRPGGTTLLIETLGTGFTAPHPPDHLQGYYHFLQQQGFSSTWIRTDYRFRDPQEAYDCTRFFFGEDLAEPFKSSQQVILPECTGLWWKKEAE